MGAVEVIALIEVATAIDSIAGLGRQVAAVAGARRAEPATLRWRDLHHSVPTVDSAVTVVRCEGGPVLVDSRTKTAQRDTGSLDPDAVELWERLRAGRAPEPRRRAAPLQAVDVALGIVIGVAAVVVGGGLRSWSWRGCWAVMGPPACPCRTSRTG